MLTKLFIENYALIDKVSLDFGKGFTIVTGETGSGKSIMLDALSLLTGERADSKAMADPSRKTIVEAIFSEVNPELENFFKEEGLDWNPEELIIRREISPTGRSRSFINDSPVTLSTLAVVTANLIDIHSQHRNIELLNIDSQLAMIDAFGGNEMILEEDKRIFNDYVNVRNEIKRKKENLEKIKANREFITFRLEQLEKIKPKDGELAQIERQYDILSDADRIKEELTKACVILNQGENSVLSSISELTGVVNEIGNLIFNSQEEEEFARRLENIRIELKDINETFESHRERIESEPGKMAKLNSRMNLIYDAIKKFKVSDESELVKLHTRLKAELREIDGGDYDLADLESSARKLANSLKDKAENLTQRRKESAIKFAELVEHTASGLGLNNLKFEVSLEKKKLTANGQDKIEFLCSFNKNMPLRPISKVASGGETARLMLSIKSIMAKCQNLPTLIFDEIDTGVSGDIASRMGKMMKDISSAIQVMSITHLPQVAAYGDSHFKVYKTDDEQRTHSHVRKLTGEEKVKEIAGMLSGTDINEAALLNAKSLMENLIQKQN